MAIYLVGRCSSSSVLPEKSTGRSPRQQISKHFLEDGKAAVIQFFHHLSQSNPEVLSRNRAHDSHEATVHIYIYTYHQKTTIWIVTFARNFMAFHE